MGGGGAHNHRSSQPHQSGRDGSAVRSTYCSSTAPSTLPGCSLSPEVQERGYLLSPWTPVLAHLHVHLDTYRTHTCAYASAHLRLHTCTPALTHLHSCAHTRSFGTGPHLQRIWPSSCTPLHTVACCTHSEQMQSNAQQKSNPFVTVPSLCSFGAPSVCGVCCLSAAGLRPQKMASFSGARV